MLIVEEGSNTPKFVKYLNEKYQGEVEIKRPEEKGFKMIKIRWIGAEQHPKSK
jgi:hypothetical protein